MCCALFQPISDLGVGFPVYSIFVDPMGGTGAYSTGAVSVPPYAEEQVEWHPRGGGSDEVRVVVDRKVCPFRGCVVTPC